MCKAAKTKILVPTRLLGTALQQYFRNMAVRDRSKLTLADFAEFVGISDKDLWKYCYQRHLLKVPAVVDYRIHLIATNPHWYALVKASQAKNLLWKYGT